MPDWRPDRRQWWLLGGALLAASLPHLARMPWSLVTIWGLLAGTRLALGMRGLAQIPVWVKLPLALLIGVLVLHHYGNLVSREAAVTLLVMMAAMKLLELSRPRDAYILVFTGFFLVSTAFLGNQGLVMGLYLPPAFLVLLVAWMSLEESPDACRCRGLLRDALRLTLFALPPALALFLLLPRLPAPLWELPDPEGLAHTGLSETMEPGRISALALSPEPVARIRFEGRIPPPWLRYFRGPVLEATDGRRWEVASHRKPERGVAEAGRFASGARGIAYEVLLEPQPGDRYLPVLEYPASVPPGARLRSDFTLVSQTPLHHPRLYRMRAAPDVPPGRITSADRILNLIVPDDLPSRVRALAERFRAEGATPEGIIRAALAHFRDRPFSYTLHPPRLDGPHPVEAFLFETRSGFCEHYAAAFTLLMRAAGLPARVVTGYQGGEINELGGFLILRKADAHAWSEVWIEGKGWVRVDPTSAVAPERIERPVDPYASQRSHRLRFRIPEGHPLGMWWTRLREGWDALDAAWQRTLLDFDSVGQRRWLGRLGLEVEAFRLAALLFLAALAPLAATAVLLLIRRWRRSASDPALALYRKFLHTLRRNGIEAVACEGPCTLLEKIRTRMPDSAAEAEGFVTAYVRLRYGRISRGEREPLLAEMRRRLRALRRF